MKTLFLLIFLFSSFSFADSFTCHEYLRPTKRVHLSRARYVLRLKSFVQRLKNRTQLSYPRPRLLKLREDGTPVPMTAHEQKRFKTHFKRGEITKSELEETIEASQKIIKDYFEVSGSEDFLRVYDKKIKTKLSPSEIDELIKVYNYIAKYFDGLKVLQELVEYSANTPLSYIDYTNRDQYLNFNSDLEDFITVLDTVKATIYKKLEFNGRQRRSRLTGRFYRIRN